MPEHQNIPKLATSAFVSRGADATRIKLNNDHKAATVAPGWKNPQERLSKPPAIKPPVQRQPYRGVLDKAADSEESKRTTGLIVKLGICACVCTLALGLRLVNTPATERIARDVKNAITTEMDIDDTIGKLKFVQNDSATVFGDSINVTLPVKGEIRQKFGDADSEGILFGCTKGSSVVACADGVVEALGQSEEMGNYVQLRHAAGLETYAYGLSEVSVEKGQPLKSGDVLGKAAGDTLYFESRVNGWPQDPLKLYSSAMMG